MNFKDVEQCTLDTKRDALKMKKSPEKIKEMIGAITELGMAMAEERSEAEKEQERILGIQKAHRARDALLVKPLLENAEKLISSEQAANVATFDQKSVADLSKYMVPAFIKNLAIKNIIGVQPMTGPVGILYALKYNNNPAFEESEVNDHKISLELISKTVEAGSRKLPFDIPFDELRDAALGTSTQTIPNMIAENVYEEVKNELVNIAHKDSVNVTNNYTFGAISVIIGRFTNEIARNTRRGSGNWIIVSETVAKILKPVLIFDEAYSDQEYGYLDYIGGLQGGMVKVYLDKKIKHNKLLMGYKGGSGETDTGYWYCPYNPIIANGPVISPHTFEPLVTFFTRYGKSTEQPTKIETVVEDGKETTTTVRYACDYFYDVTLEGLPVLDKLVIEEPKEKPANVLDDEPAATTFEDLFDDAMSLFD